MLFRSNQIVYDRKGKPITDVVAKDSIVGMKGYAAFLGALQDLYGDDISKVLWNDWCQIVGEKIVKSGTKDEIILNVNNQEFKIKPYSAKKHLLTMMSKEKQNLSLVDPESLGLGVSLGHLDAIRSGEKYRTPQIKAMESYADMAFHMGSDVDALHDLIADFINDMQLKRVYNLAMNSKWLKASLIGQIGRAHV